MTRCLSRIPVCAAIAFVALASLAADAQPAVPADLLATAGDEQAVLTWQNPSNSNIVRYEFRFGAGEAPEFNAWTEVPDSGAETVEHTVRGLTNGTEYVFELRAADDTGASDAARASTRLAISPTTFVHVPDEQLRRLMLSKLERYADITQGNLAKIRELRDTQRGWISDLAGLEFAINLVTLSLPGNEISDISPLLGLTSLREVYLSGNQITDVSPLSSLVSLRRLDLSFNNISRLPRLLSLTSLSRLDLADNKISDIASLAGLNSLLELDLSRNELANVMPVSDLTSLTVLRLSRNEIEDTTPLSGLTSLRDLELQGNEIEEISALADLNSLRYLWLSENHITDTSPLSTLTSLQQLSLAENGLTDLSPLSGLTSLRALHLSNNKVIDVSALSGLISLRYLYLSNNEVSDLSPLSSLTSLRGLSLAENGLTDVRALRDLRVASLNLSGNKLTDLSALSGLPALGDLNLSGNELTDISALRGLPTLVDLNLSDNELTDVSALSRLTGLMTLDLSGNELTEVPALAHLTSLTALHLAGNRIADVSLIGLTSLTTLDLSGNPVSSVSLEGLTSMTELDLSNFTISNISLSGMTSLWHVDLSGNQLSDISSLASLGSLNRLWLSRNAISDLSALSGLTSLTWITLSGNEISDLSPLSNLTSLKSLSLCRNEIADVSMLSSLKLLTRLSLCGNEIADISPLSGLVRLWDLDLSDNQLSDLSPLSGLSRLTGLDLSGNAISDVWPLSGLTALTSLDLSGNAISSVSPLSDLTSMTWLRLRHNGIADVWPLSGMTSLAWVWLDGNAISDISSIGGLERLSFLVLRRNGIADISPLIESGLSGPQDYVDLRGNRLGDGQAGHVRALRESGVAVAFDDGGHRVPLFPSAAGGASVTGFVRVINHSAQAGSLFIEAVDETGRIAEMSLSINVGQALHFNARDLERGNPDKGLRGAGEPVGDWGLTLRSRLEVEVLGYARTPDGFVTSLHDLAREYYGTSVVPTFNPGSNRRQVSRLRLLNPTAWDREAEIDAGDDAGVFAYRRPRIRTPARRALDLTAAQLESGEGIADFAGIGDGTGKWRLYVDAPGQRVMSLLQSPTGHLANISTGTAVPRSDRAFYSWARGGRHRVPLFLAGSSDIQGFVRFVNHSSASAEIELRAFDGSGVERDPVVLNLKGSHGLHFNSADLESGNAAKGLPGIGAPAGDWHLEVSADRRFEVLAYARTRDGFVTSMHDIAPRAEDGSLWIPFFNPGGNPNQISRLRLVNWGDTAAEVTIEGTDDAGNSPGEAVRVTVPARAARDYLARELETGQAAGLSGALGDGDGKWRLRVFSTGDIEAMSLLGLPTGHITNLSTTPRFPPQ